MAEKIALNAADIVQSETGVQELEKEVQYLDQLVNKMSANGGNVAAFTTYIIGFHRNIDALRKVITDVKTSSAGKVLPTVIAIGGKPGVGKSEFAGEIIRQLELREGRALSVFTRNSATDKFFSQYAFQDILLYDDFSQDKEDKDHGEMIQIYSRAAYQLNMSESKEKGRMFASKYVIILTNNEYIEESSCIKELSAVMRRRDWLYHVTPSAELLAYKEQHGRFPREDSELWHKDFSHLTFDEWMPDNKCPEYSDDHKVIRHNVQPETIYDEMYSLKCKRVEAYEQLVRERDHTRDFLVHLHELMHIDIDEIHENADNPDPVERRNQRCARRRMMRDRAIQFAHARAMGVDVHEIEDLIDVLLGREEFNQESIITDIVSQNLFLLLGPSGCGKSELMKTLRMTKVHSVGEIFGLDGKLKIPPNSNLHFEDASITPDVTNAAIEVCQRLSDCAEFSGVCVFSANPDMLYKNLRARGAEAVEVFDRRCKVIEIGYKMMNRLWNRYKAKDIGRIPGLNWDDMYRAQCNGIEMNFTETQLLITTNEHCIKTYAVFDEETLRDFTDGPVETLHFPGLDWATFSEMDDYSQIRNYVNLTEAARAIFRLRAYEVVLRNLPRRLASPLHMVRLMNNGSFRVPISTPSIQLNFVDFTIKFINHKTFCMAQMATPHVLLPDLSIVPEDNPVKDLNKIEIFETIWDFVKLIFGGTLIARELLGYNQGGESTFFEAEARKKTKHAKSVPKIARSAVSKPKKADVSPNGNKWVAPQEGELDTEGRKKTQHAKKQPKIPRSQTKKEKKPDVSPGAAKQQQADQEYDNECRNYALGYSGDMKRETKILTHTDLEPKYDIPDFDNIVEIPTTSRYHPNNWAYIADRISTTGSDKVRDLCDQFDEYLLKHTLDKSFIVSGSVHFDKLAPNKREQVSDFLNTFKHISLDAESMADPQAASLIPLLSANQVFIYESNQMSQRALMIKGHVGVTVSHGITRNSVVKIPGNPVFYGIQILSDQPERDLCIFKIQKQAPQFKDIRHFIRSREDRDLLDGIDCFLLTVHEGKRIVERVQASRVDTCKEVRYAERMVRGFTYAGTVTGFHLPLPSLTEKGFCGSPTVLCNTRYMRKIISIHAAANDVTAFGIPIYKEMFDEHFQPESLPVQSDIVVLKHQELNRTEPEIVHGFISEFELKHNNSAPNKTNIYRSPLQSDMFGDNFEPAILSNYDTRNIDNVDISHVTIEKWNQKQPENLDEELLDYCVDQWGNYFSQVVRQNQKQQFVLTKTEAINRTTYYGSSQPVARDTSAGYPWKHRTGAVGKKLFIQPRQFGDIVLQTIPQDQNGRDLHNAIDHLIKTCERGERPAVVFSSSAKDEVLKKKKIYPCRTRGFAGAPIDYSLAHRMYFHTAICALIETRKTHPIKVGIEANGNEWDDLFRYLSDNSTVGFDVDFKDWDSTIPRKVMEKLVRIYNKIYGACCQKPEDLDKDNRIREALHSVLHGPLLTYMQKVVQAPGGQVSGQPATTIDNCLVACILAFYIWMVLAPQEMKNFEAFMKHVRLASYGDDQACSVKPEALKFYNMQSFCKIAGEHFGMTATPASKEDESRDFKPITEIEFLKRNFIKVGPIYYGKIQPSVIDKMLNWTHTHRRHHYYKEPTKVHFDIATIEASIDSLLYEVCLYEPEDWDKLVNHLAACLGRLGSKKLLPTQTDTLEKRGISHKLFLSARKQN